MMRSGWHACWDAKLHATAARASVEHDLFEAFARAGRAFGRAFTEQARAMERAAAALGRAASAMQRPPGGPCAEEGVDHAA